MAEIIVGDIVTGERLLSSEEVAARAGIARKSLEAQRSRGGVPDPDGWVGRTPVWRESTINTWLQQRRPPGRPKTAASE